MAHDPGRRAPPAGTRRDADVARIRQRLSRMSPQTKALRLALARYQDESGTFDLALWNDAFTSDDPHAINHVLEVTGGYEGLVNHLLEMLHVGAALVGVPPGQQGRRLTAPDLIAAATEDGCLSTHHADVLTRLNRTRNRLQHNSPGVPADEVHERLKLLLKTMPPLLSSYVAWMQRHGVQLLPDKRS